MITSHDLDSTADSIADYFPNGPLLRAKKTESSELRYLLLGLAAQILVAEGKLIETEANLDINYASALISEWESLVGIPDSCFPATETLAERRRDVLLKLSSSVQTAQDFIDVANILGVTIEINSGRNFTIFPVKFPVLFFATTKESRFTLVVDLDIETKNVFPLTFPFVFEDNGAALIRCIFDKLKPANVAILYRNIVDNSRKPIVNLPLTTNLELITGSGSVTYSRAGTATYVDGGVLKYAAIDEPRFEDGRLLYEGASTNLKRHSDDFSNAVWLKALGMVVTQNVTTAPDGTLTADLITSATSFQTIRQQSIVIVADSGVSDSVYFKPGTSTILRVYVGDSTLGNAFYYTVNTSTLAITLATAGTGTGIKARVTEVSQGFFKLEVSGNIGSGVTLARIDYFIEDNSTIFLWRSQFENLGVVTSSIPTTTVAATRASDILTLQYNDNFPAIGQPVTVLLDAEYFGNSGGTQRTWQVVGESFRLIQIAGAGTRIDAVYGTGADSVLTSPNVPYTMGYIYDGTNIEASVDGIPTGSPGVATTPTGSATAISLGSTGAGALPFYGHLTNFRIYNVALEESELG